MSMLVSFEAAGRLGGFKLAASELNVTPAAISHQVKALERELRTPLFRRHHRGVDLTEAGALLLQAVRSGFENIDAALDRIRARGDEETVTIHASTAVSSLWLASRLAEFWRTHGDVPVSQFVSDGGHAQVETDLSIRYGDMAAEDGECRKLFRDRIMALAGAGFLERRRIGTVEELAQAPLIHVESPGDDWTSWQDWFAAAGYRGPVRASYRVNNYLIALQAAQDDRGAVLGWIGLTQFHLDSRRLAPALPCSVPAPHAHYIKLNPNAPARARLVWEWLSQAPRDW